MHDTAREVGTNSLIFSFGSLHTDVQVLADQQEHLQQLCTDTGCSLEDLLEVIDDRRIAGESGKSVLAARHDNDIKQNTPHVMTI